MALGIDGILFDELTSDPGTPAEGQMWYNTTDQQAKGYFNGATRVIADSRHTGDSSNPHSVSLEQARTQSNVLAGDVNMNSAGTITNLPDPTNDGDAANKGWTNDQIAARLRGLDWQDSVLDRYDPTSATPPAPSTGDRYISTATANGWTDDYIYEWDGSAWEETVPNEGCCARVEDENVLYIFDGTSWGTFGGAIDHGNLLGKDDDDHTQYLLVSGTRAMSGGLDMGTNAITNVGNVDGVDVSNHSARHDPGGGDALTTAAPSQGIGAGNSEGTATSFARSDHDHKLRTTTGPTDLTVAGIGDGEYLKRSGTTITSDSGPGVNYLAQKAGRVLAAGFSGSPKTATVTFSSAFANADYAVTLTARSSGNKSFAPSVSAQTAGSFTIMLGSNSTTNLVHVGWIAMKDGESS